MRGSVHSVMEVVTHKHSRTDVVDSMTAYLVEEVGLDAPEARREADDLVRDAGELRGILGEMWWSLALRGVLAITIGFLFLARPLQGLSTLVILFGAWIFVDGVITLITAISRHRSWQLAILGVIGVGLGYLILTRPTGAAVVFVVLAAAWIMTHGVTEIALGASVKRGVAGRGTMIALGLASFVFGIFLIAAPAMGLTVVGWWIGAYALFAGALFILLAVQVRRIKRDVTALGERHPLPA